METLKCTKCKEIKSTDLFNKHKNRKTGFQSMCKICTKGYHEQYQDKNKEKLKEYREKNISKIKERKKQYREENKEKLSENQKQLYIENKEKMKEHHRQYREENKEKIKKKDTEKRYNLHTSYVKHRLKQQGFKSEQITEELIQLKTITLKTQRLCNQLKN